MLPIGSIVYLKKGRRKLMVLNRAPLIPEENTDKMIMFDYSGCLYPNGLNLEEIYYFNEENIDKVIFQGYSDDEEIRFTELYNEMEEKIKDRYSKGKIEEL